MLDGILDAQNNVPRIENNIADGYETSEGPNRKPEQTQERDTQSWRVHRSQYKSPMAMVYLSPLTAIKFSSAEAQVITNTILRSTWNIHDYRQLLRPLQYSCIAATASLTGQSQKTEARNPAGSKNKSKMLGILLL